jgi:AP endonuclease-2
LTFFIHFYINLDLKGTRIDYILASNGLKDYFQFSDIQADILGSDHCPVYADFLPFPETTSQEMKLNSPLLTINFPEFKQNKLFSYFAKKSSTPQQPPKRTIECEKQSSIAVKKSRITEKDIMSNYFISNTTKTNQQPTVVNKEESKTQWSSLFQAPTIPNCKIHDIPCLERTVTKKGLNSGRKFYICAKPVGPKDTVSLDYSCNYFQWKK